ncbi:hypothetical protein LCGC14_1615530 [marine sediment metagenome]|uniref:DNA polymerase beta thumb domain-containing protein n=1 Tax=marine sediment metagenome TaxID=412755 RepID=A0A0F9I793_9ZZZZ
MELENALVIANEVVDKVKPFCKKVMIAGSIRRKRRHVNDVDIVLIPGDAWHLYEVIQKLKESQIAAGSKIERFIYKSLNIDLYYATSTNWATLLLIRTGSKENNRRLCGIAKAKDWHLFADGMGLMDENNDRIAGDTEESIYEALGLPYQEPEERN